MDTYKSAVYGSSVGSVGSSARTGSPNRVPIKPSKGHWVRTGPKTSIMVTFKTISEKVFPDPDARKLFPYGEGAGDFTD